jgi:hypothetical protein
MRRLSAMVLMLAVAALGSGALRYVHELDHIARDAHSCETGTGSDQHAPSSPAHDDAECFLHAQLNLPMVGGGGYVALLVCFGVFVAFLTSVSVPVLCRRPVLLLDSRGPPAAQA